LGPIFRAKIILQLYPHFEICPCGLYIDIEKLSILLNNGGGASMDVGWTRDGCALDVPWTLGCTLDAPQMYGPKLPRKDTQKQSLTYSV